MRTLPLSGNPSPTRKLFICIAVLDALLAGGAGDGINSWIALPGPGAGAVGRY